MTQYKLSEFDKAHMTEIVQGREGYDWFSCHLIRLIAKADVYNRGVLKTVYPEHVEAYEDWFYRREQNADYR